MTKLRRTYMHLHMDGMPTCNRWEKLVLVAPQLDRITVDPARMGGRPCIRDLRVTVATIVGLLADGMTEAEILRDYPYLERDDIRQALSYAAWLAREETVQG